MIMLYKPYSINHYVDAGGTSGSVEEVQIFSTILRTPDNVKVIVPNSAILNKNIKNYSAFDNRRIDLVVSIPYEDNIGAVRNLLMEITASHPLVLSEPAPTVEVQELAASSVNLAVHPWVRTENYEQVRSDLLEQIKLRVK
jgi:small conductance mechanosensitive channel